MGASTARSERMGGAAEKGLENGMAKMHEGRASGLRGTSSTRCRLR